MAFDANAADVYDALAPAYDVLTGSYPHDRWLARLEQLAVQNGLTGRRVLDVACGTGASFLPLLARGYDVTACDISEAMLERARGKAPHAHIHRADMRQLGVLGAFDLITCLDDALNYLTDEDEFEAALRGFAQNLAPGGVAIWDLNTIVQYRGQFARDQVIARSDLFIGWSAQAAANAIDPGALVEIAIDVFALEGDHWRRSTGIHRQRHWSRATVERLANQAGLDLLDVRGQHPGAVIDGALDELVHTKAIYLATTRERG